ncbi:GNAT family N-acetyltransferase [Pseudomonas sp. PDM23]|uniref:GNAT family N-acetyltransferase n=1 Tax=unclassified Pseudomonas TaxID=196821 RepID=UPI00178502FD|nr:MULTISPECIES: GNAT family N-acetyltransferase [unclassified Pseudomonas]MBD9504469.1 GNAT family N-acetyltransferase [Pseudomonas sp. PDM17]MBD9577938.1 GNAT family N-acetyltransferase [Pseudomonas sp. PDM23]MBD9672496.1 GNAT family N-acetyltransferase [Pseudomonas sp. PDM21]
MRLLSIREARPGDVPAVLELMRALAEFEGYLDGFAVDGNALLTRAFGSTAQCQVFVAQTDTICGYAVVQCLDFTFDLRPSVRLKELYVSQGRRGEGVGEQLMRRVAQWALEQGAGRLLWDVLTGNDAAERFYSRLGGRRENRWMAYRMDDRELLLLADR